jgi:hypothetical protein
MPESQSNDASKADTQLATSSPKEIGVPRSDAGTVTNYIPESEAQKIAVSRNVILAILALLAIIPTAGVFVYMNSRQQVNEAETGATIDLKVREIDLLERHHDKEIELIQKRHDAELAAREKVFDAELRREREKGWWARNVTPWGDWWRGSDVEVEAGPVRVKVEPKK